MVQPSIFIKCAHLLERLHDGEHDRHKNHSNQIVEDLRYPCKYHSFNTAGGIRELVTLCEEDRYDYLRHPSDVHHEGDRVKQDDLPFGA